MFADEKDVKATEPEAKTAAEETPAKKAPAKKPAAKKPAAKKDDAKKDDAKSDDGAEKKAPAKKATAKKPAAKKDDVEKTEAQGKDGVADEAAEKKAPGKKAPTKKPAAKKAAPKEPVNVEPTFVRATARYVRSSPRKSRLVVDHIRDSSVEDARVFLQFTARHVGRDVAKVLESAVANAEHNHELDVDNLHIVKAFVDEGPTLKRWRPRAKGRATQILKRTSHITVVVSDVPSTELKKMSELKKTRKVVA